MYTVCGKLRNLGKEMRVTELMGENFESYPDDYQQIAGFIQTLLSTPIIESQKKDGYEGKTPIINNNFRIALGRERHKSTPPTISTTIL